MQCSAIVFDMDGLLLDSERVALLAFTDTCLHFGLGDQHAVFLRCIGSNRAAGERILREGLGDKVDPLEFGRVWDVKYIEATTARPVPLKDGVRELLGDLDAMGIRAAVATSTSAARATRKLQTSGIARHFDVLVGGDEVERSKPHPDIFLKAADRLRVRPADCLALEDSENGVRAALDAGMTVIQIPDLVEPSAEFRALGHTILRSLHDVRAWLTPRG